MCQPFCRRRVGGSFRVASASHCVVTPLRKTVHIGTRSAVPLNAQECQCQCRYALLGALLRFRARRMKRWRISPSFDRWSYMRSSVVPATALSAAVGGTWYLILYLIAALIGGPSLREHGADWPSPTDPYLLRLVAPVFAASFIAGFVLSSAARGGWLLSRSNQLPKALCFGIAFVAFTWSVDGFGSPAEPFSDQIVSVLVRTAVLLMTFVSPIGDWVANRLIRFLHWAGAPTTPIDT